MLAGDFYFQACRLDVAFEGEVGTVGVGIKTTFAFLLKFDAMFATGNLAATEHQC